MKRIVVTVPTDDPEIAERLAEMIRELFGFHGFVTTVVVEE